MSSKLALMAAWNVTGVLGSVVKVSGVRWRVKKKVEPFSSMLSATTVASVMVIGLV